MTIPSNTLAEELSQALEKADEAFVAQDFQSAVDQSMRGLSVFGEQEGFLKILATLAFKQQDLKHAEEFYTRLSRVSPNDAMVWSGLAMVYGAIEQTDKAVIALQKAVALKPEKPAPYLNLGIALMKVQRIMEAQGVLENAIKQFPDFIQLRIWLGHALSALEKTQQAMTQYYHVVKADPNDLSVSLPLALLERDSGNMEASNACLDKVLARFPDHPVAKFTKSQNLLMVGKLAEGFKLYECRWDREGMHRPDLKGQFWQGQDLSGKSILIYAEQGFGDALQFIRFLPQLKALGAEVHLKAHPRLHKILSTIGSVDRFLVNDEDDQADYNLPMMSLPHLLGADLENIPAEIPYLTADEKLISEWNLKLVELAGTAKLKAGLVWQGDPGSQAEKGRSVPLENLLPLFENKHVHFFLLQKQDGLEQLAELSLPDNVTNLGSQIDLGEDAFTDTAAIMRCLDLMISSDTSPAHLSGGLGVKTWVMLKCVPEWRWMLDRADSPWYPTATLYRQSEMADWESVVQKLSNDLASLTR